MLRFRCLFPLLLLVFSVGLIQPVHALNSVKNLPPVYRHWIEVEVPYIISSTERKQFLTLTTDAERDHFIDTFWRIRNPNPSSVSNSYKDEHYRRLAYANEHFGTAKYEDGWRTDMGRIYIILGAPKQRAPYHALANLRPMEIWFYQSETPALPPYFYLLFFKPSAGELYRLYSPTEDTPVRLCSTGESQNDPKIALRILRKFAGDEVARTAITLLPTENVNLDEFAPSMSSDMLMATLNDLPDNPITKEQLEANRLREHVTMSLLLGGSDSTLSSDSFRDDHGRMTLSYLMRMQFADARMIGARADGSAYYDETLRTTVLTQAGKPVYDQEEQLTGDLTAAEAEVARKKRFGAEGRLPLDPGTYTLVVTLTNNLNQIATRQHATVTVPVAKSGSVGISGLLAYKLPAGVTDPRGALPFSISHFRFTPVGAENIYLPQGHRLSVVFQLWLDPKGDTPVAAAEKIHLHYVFGSIAATQEHPAHEDEDVDAGNRDAAGNLLTGHTLDTAELEPGAYQVVVSANRVGDHRMAYATLNLHIEPSANYVDTWTAYGPEGTGGDALDDYLRGLSAEAQGNDAEAQADFTRSMAEGPREMRTLDKLVAVLARRGQTQQLAELSQLQLLKNTAVTPGTLLAIAEALNKMGDPKAVAQMLEAQIALQPPSLDLYRVLADACAASGNINRAREVRSLAANLK